MEQLVIIGLEDFSPNPIEIIESLNKKGYSWLTDCNSGNLLVGGDSREPYTPYRVQFPSGRILDEEEIFRDFSDLEKISFSREEIQLARNFYYAITHEETDKDKYKFCNYAFVSKEDEILTKEKYSKMPFYLEKNDNL